MITGNLNGSTPNRNVLSSILGWREFINFRNKIRPNYRILSTLIFLYLSGFSIFKSKLFDTIFAHEILFQTSQSVNETIFEWKANLYYRVPIKTQDDSKWTFSFEIRADDIETTMFVNRMRGEALRIIDGNDIRTFIWRERGEFSIEFSTNDTRGIYSFAICHTSSPLLVNPR